jgi:hypothetical protein
MYLSPPTVRTDFHKIGARSPRRSNFSSCQNIRREQSHFAAVLVGMVFSRFTRVVGRMEPMPVNKTGVVRRLFVITGLMVLGSFAMMSCRLFVAFCRFVVVFSACTSTHNVSPFSPLKHTPTFSNFIDSLMKLGLLGVTGPRLRQVIPCSSG